MLHDHLQWRPIHPPGEIAHLLPLYIESIWMPQGVRVSQRVKLLWGAIGAPELQYRFLVKSPSVSGG